MPDNVDNTDVEEIGLLKLKKSPHNRKYSTRNQLWEGYIYSISTPVGRRRVRQRFANIYSDGGETLLDINSGAKILKLVCKVANISGDIETHEIVPSDFKEKIENIYAIEQPENHLLFYTNEICTEGVGMQFDENGYIRYIEFKLL